MLGSEIFNVGSDEKAGDRCVEGDEDAMVMVWLWSWDVVRRRASIAGLFVSDQSFVELVVGANIAVQTLKRAALVLISFLMRSDVTLGTRTGRSSCLRLSSA